ncbi:AAA family ATPase [Candidatus Kaiserbacteria bacterium]|nr:AAA family ATPase [Candidatus Kaiserbacteria bacterium]
MEKKHIITLGGLPGAGKSTVRKLLAEALGYQTFYTGGFARQLAEERGVSLEDLNEQIVNDKSLDEIIDAEQSRINAEEDNYVVDAHIGFHFIPNSFKVFLTVPIEVSAERIFKDATSEIRQRSGDSMQSYEEAFVRTQKRIDNHTLRYKKHYGIDVYDPSQFDLVIDTSHLTPAQVVAQILTAYRTWVE